MKTTLASFPQTGVDPQKVLLAKQKYLKKQEKGRVMPTQQRKSLFMKTKVRAAPSLSNGVLVPLPLHNTRNSPCPLLGERQVDSSGKTCLVLAHLCALIAPVFGKDEL